MYTSVCTVRAQAPAGGRFYNRTHELECLRLLLSSEPECTGITVIVGPVSCGKTALVQHFIEELEQPQPPLYLDCRQHAVNTPDNFASALLDTTVSAGGGSKAALEAQVSGVEAGPGSTPIASVLDIFAKALKRTFKEGCPRTPIIIDEANALTDWSTTHPAELANLLRFFCRRHQAAELDARGAHDF